MGLIADALTAARLAMAVILVPLLSGRQLGVAGLVLGTAWITDFLDGRFARAADSPTRLGAWDLPVDTSVGIGAIVGLAVGGYLPIPLAAVVLVVFGPLYAGTRNYAASAVLQAVGYGGVLIRLFQESSSARWWPVLVAATIGILERDRFVHDTLPSFFSGIASLFGLRGSERRRD